MCALKREGAQSEPIPTVLTNEYSYLIFPSVCTMSCLVASPDLQQSLTEPPHDVQVHLVGLWISLLGVLILTLHDHVPEGDPQVFAGRCINTTTFPVTTLL